MICLRLCPLPTWPNLCKSSSECTKCALWKRVKHAIQNTQDDCHQWFSCSFRVHQIHFWLGLCLRPRWGSLQRSPRLPSWLKGDPTSKGNGKGRKREGKRVKGMGPLTLRTWLHPCSQVPKCLIVGNASCFYIRTCTAAHTATLTVMMGAIFSSKCTRNYLAAELCPYPLGKLTALPRFFSSRVSNTQSTGHMQLSNTLHAPATI